MAFEISNDDQLRAFIDKHRSLLVKEREVEIERTSLLLSSCSPSLLEQKGLALGGLGIVNVNIGLGGKTLVELERPTAYHNSPLFPPHTLRSGDLARIEEHVSSSAGTKKSSKIRKPSETKGTRLFEGVVYKVSDARIVIAVDSSESGNEELDLPDRCRVVKLANSVTYDRMEKTLDQLEKIVTPGAHASGEKGLPVTTPLVRVLLGMSKPSPQVPVVSLKFYDETLNPSQQEAVKFAIEAPDVACIHGPPGTGKTHTLIEIIRQFTTVTDHNSKPLRLLVCGASNLSVDNILERLLCIPPSENGEKLKVTRVGHPARVMAHQGVLDATLEAKAGRTDQAALAKDVKSELENEATQALEAVCWIPILKSKKLILAGDPMQLPPTILSADKRDKSSLTKYLRPTRQSRPVAKLDKETPPSSTPASQPASETDAESGDSDGDSMTASDEEPVIEAVDSAPPTQKKKASQISQRLRPPRSLETTLFSRLEQMYGPAIKRMLTVQYRMHAKIAAFPSKVMYHSKLNSHASVAAHLLRDLPNTKAESEEEETELLGTPVAFVDTAGCEYFERTEGDGDEGSRCNENEATVVKRCVEQLVGVGLLPSQIAIITP
ncbi:hypothetical protein EW026_g3058 [Hermanssonia centrifuga]|uniref:DNA helicase n=1 Tax=Hermanssonia centrifuga TaxID=98765 RepID=A0A4S4KLD0_9APHY|nr:hypothetical protein EW026_g3058 [Hermanssonia centrifuga]